MSIVIVVLLSFKMLSTKEILAEKQFWRQIFRLETRERVSLLIGDPVHSLDVSGHATIPGQRKPERSLASGDFIFLIITFIRPVSGRLLGTKNAGSAVSVRAAYLHG